MRSRSRKDENEVFMDTTCDYCHSPAQSEVTQGFLGLCYDCQWRIRANRCAKRPWTPPPGVDVSQLNLVTAGMEYGLYATEDIPPREIIAEIQGEIIDQDECEQVLGRGPPYRVMILRNDDYFLPDDENVASFVNYSCDPNAEMVFRTDGGKQQVLVVCGEETIHRDSEITVKCNMVFGDDAGDIPCLCGSQNCNAFLHQKQS